MQTSERTWKLSPRAWTLLVLVIGLVLGVSLALIPRPIIVDIDIAVGTIELSFLFALLYVHVKTYSDTHSRFALGLLMVLLALLLQALLSDPMFYAALGRVSLSRQSPLVLAVDTLQAFAYGAFLYLSLQ